ncbi:hypothetical protein [Dyella flagellata]|uniref:hypothetical protein n=1 Tax=Dyella flagellata TaxID=1867833 RepID=UPI0024E0C743|nr:hypothetical protein [Dyella flagellata]
MQPHDTVQSVAATHNVTPEELARTNNISVDSDLSHIAVLTLPPNATTPATSDQQPPPQAPAQKTDAAIAAYDAAVKQRDDAVHSAPHNGSIRQDIFTSESDAVDQAQKAMDAAIKDEIGGQIASRNAGVPADFQTPSDQIIKSAGDAIAARHQGDAVAQSAIGNSVDAYQMQQKTDALIPSFSGPLKASDKLARLSTNLQGQPQDVIDHVAADPRVQGWISDAAKEAGHESTADCAKDLADLTQNVPPDIARQVIQQWWTPADPNDLVASASPSGVASMAASDKDTYKNLAAIYGALGDDPQSQSLKQQIASTIAGQQQDNPTVASRTFADAISDGGDAKLAIDVASQMQAAGKTDAAKYVMGAAKLGTITMQKQTLTQDMQAYGKQTQELKALIDDLGPGLTPEQKQNAINGYIASKSKDWQDQLAAIKDKLVSDTRAFSGDIGALLDVPDNVKQLAPSRDFLGKLTDDDTTHQAIAFAATQDPSVFKTKEAGEGALLMLEVAHKSKDFVAAVGSAYIGRNILPALADLKNPNDPAQIAKVNQALQNLKDVAGIMGLPKSDIDEGTDKLQKAITALTTPAENTGLAEGVQGLNAATAELSELKDFSFISGPAGLLFRTAALAISGGALLSQTGATMDDPSIKNGLAELAFGVGAAQDAAHFGTALNLVDRNSNLGKWGLGTSEAGEATEKFVGVLNVFYFADIAVGGAQKNDTATELFSVAGVAGGALSVFGGSEALGGLAGPIGFGIATVASIGVGVAEHYAKQREYHEAEVKFLEDAGIGDNIRAGMLSVPPEQIQDMQNRGMSPEQIQIQLTYPTDVHGRPY